MSFSVTMPALGESVSEGTVTRWLKQEGEQVAVDEPLLEVSTDKVDTEIPSPAAGVLQRIVVTEDQTVEVGAELAVIGDGAEGGAEAGGASDGGQEAQQSAPSADQAPATAPEPQVAQAEQPSEQEASDTAPAADTAPAPAQAADTAPAEAGGEGSAGGSAQGTSVTMPALGESVTEGTVTRWLKSVGESVGVDEPLLEVSTDKVDTEIPSPVAGTLLEVSVQEDETVPVGAQLAIIGDQSGSAADAPAPQQAVQAEPTAVAESPDPSQDEQVAQQAAPPAPAAQQSAPPAPAAKITSAPAPPPAPREGTAQPASSGNGEVTDGAAYVTPLVRKLAAEQGIDLSRLTGTGVGGRIRKQDVLEAASAAREAAAAQPAQQSAAGQQPSTASAPASAQTQAPTAAPVSPLRGTTEKMSRLRKVIAARMVESLQTSAQLTTVVEVDITRVTRLRELAKRDFESREGVKLSFLPFFAKAAVEALKSYPKINASIEGDSIVYHGAEHLGIAVDTERGLLVPVIKDAGDLNIGGLARKIADLAERTRSNKVTPDELGGGTFTLTNTGSRGALFDTPIINQPQVGILGTGAMVKRPMVVTSPDLGETIAIRSMVYLALSYDHRLVDGADAARFLSAVKARLEEGLFEGDLGL